MAGLLAKLEGLIVVPTGGWTCTITEVGGVTAQVVTIAAGNYYWTTGGTTFLAELKAKFDAIGDGTYTFSLSSTANASTGILTITATGITSFAVTWNTTTSVALRNNLGFIADITATLSAVSPKAVRYLFLPTVYRTNPGAPEPSAVAAVASMGSVDVDATFTMAPSGAIKSLGYSTRYRENIDFAFLPAKKTVLEHEVVPNESLQRFWEDTVAVGRSFNYHPSRDTSVTYEMVADPRAGYHPLPTTPGWVGASSTWNVQMPAFKKV